MNIKKTAEKTAKPSVAARKADAPVKTYATFGALLASKAKKGLPRGTTAKVDSANKTVTFTAKGATIAKLDLADFANAELKRHGFQLAA